MIKPTNKKLIFLILHMIKNSIWNNRNLIIIFNIFMITEINRYYKHKNIIINKAIKNLKKKR